MIGRGIYRGAKKHEKQLTKGARRKNEKASGKHERLAMQGLKSVKISTGSRIPAESLKRKASPPIKEQIP